MSRKVLLLIQLPFCWIFIGTIVVAWNYYLTKSAGTLPLIFTAGLFLGFLTVRLFCRENPVSIVLEAIAAICVMASIWCYVKGIQAANFGDLRLYSRILRLFAVVAFVGDVFLYLKELNRKEG